MILSPTCCEKSIIISILSAGINLNDVRLTGSSINPPSVPIWINSSLLESLIIYWRLFEAFKILNLYLRGSTSKYGQTLPFTTIVSPKNPGTIDGNTLTGNGGTAG